MTQIIEGRLTFSFPQDVSVSKYDDWAFYRNQVNSAFGGAKAVDIVCADDGLAWLIEVKDYRASRRTKAIDIGDEVAFKVRDTLAGLAAARCYANNPDEKGLARVLLRKPRIRVVLHLEQPAKHSTLFPRAIDPSNVKMKLKQLLRCVDAHPAVVDQHNLKPEMNWTVTG